MKRKTNIITLLCLMFLTSLSLQAQVTKNEAGIRKVTIANIDHYSQVPHLTKQKKQDFSQRIFSKVVPGNQYPFEILTGSNQEFLQIMVDWNHDGRFNPLSEVIYRSSKQSGIHQGIIEVPTTATMNVPLKMEVASYSSLTFQGEPLESEYYSLFVLAAMVEVTLEDNLIIDNNGNLVPNPGDTLEYTLTITNTGDMSATDLSINRSMDPNTSLDPSSIRATPLAISDTFPFITNTLVVSAANGLLSNDLDINDVLPNPPYNENLTVQEAAGGAVGVPQTTLYGATVTVMADGSFVYDSTGFTGTSADTFAYKIIDSEGFTDSAIATISMNMPPVLANIEMSAAAFMEDGGAIQITATITASDPDDVNLESGIIQITGAYVMGEDLLSVSGVLPGGIAAGAFNAANGSITLTGTSSVANYQTALRQIQYNNSSQDPNTMTRTVSFTVNDGDINSNTITRDISVTAVNDCPVAGMDGFTTSEDTATMTGNVLTNDMDAEMDMLMVSAVNGNPASVGMQIALASGALLTQNSDGSYAYDPNGNYDTLNMGSVGMDTYMYTVSDGDMTCMQPGQTTTVTLTINGINDLPVAVDDDIMTVPQDMNYNHPAPGILTNDTDVDMGSTRTVYSVNGMTANVGMEITLSSGSKLTVNADGSFIYEATCATGAVDSFFYKIIDDNGGISVDSAKVLLNIDIAYWFVDDGGSMGAAGSFSDPFPTLAAAEAASSAGDYIFVFAGTYPTGITLKNNQKLLGEGVAWNCPLDGSLIQVAGTMPTINGQVSLAQNDTLGGIVFGSVALFSLSGGAVGNLTINFSSIINTLGGGLDVNTSGALDVVFNQISTQGGSNGIRLQNTTGIINGGIGMMQNSTGSILDIDGGSITFTYNGSITQTSNAPVVNIQNGHNGTITFQTGMINATNGTGLQFNNADGNYNFNGTTGLNGGDAGIDILNGSGGTFGFSANSSITNPSGPAFVANNSSANITFNGTITQNNAARGIDLNANTGTSTFAGTLSLNTTTQTALRSISGGTVNIVGANNIISTTSATAIEISNSTIGASGVTWQSVSVGSGGGPVDGIILNTTGTGTFTITGTGTTNQSGGLIQNCTARGLEATNSGPITISNVDFINCATVDGPGPCGTPLVGITGCNSSVFLNNVNTVNLLNITTQNGQFGIIGNNVTGLNLLNSFIDNHGDEIDEDNIRFYNLLGTCNIKGNTIEDARHNNLYVWNNSSTALTLNVGSPAMGEANTIQRAGKGMVGQGNDGILIEGQMSADMTVNIDNNDFLTSDGDHVQTAMDDNADLTVNIRNNTMNTVTTVLGSGITISCSGDYNGEVNYDISGNGINDNQGTAINVNLGTSLVAGGTGEFVGMINSNTINGDGGGIDLVANGAGNSYATINGNTINGFDADYAIRAITRDGSADIFLTLTNNTINAYSNSNPFVSLLIQAGASSGPPCDNGTICAHITGNDFIPVGGIPAGYFTDFRIRQRFATGINLPGYGGSITDDAAVVTFVQGNNTGTPSGSATHDTSLPCAGSGFTGTGMSCPTNN